MPCTAETSCKTFGKGQIMGIAAPGIATSTAHTIGTSPASVNGKMPEIGNKEIGDGIGCPSKNKS